MKKVAPLYHGVIFKKVFSHPDIFAGFASDIIGIPLEIENVNIAHVPFSDKADVYCQLLACDKKKSIIINLQHVRDDEHYDFFLHTYHKALFEFLASSPQKNLKIFNIVIINTSEKHRKDVLVTECAPLNSLRSENKNAHKIFFLCPKYLNENTPLAYQEWLKAIEDSLDRIIEETEYQNLFVRRIFNLIEESQISLYDKAQMKDEFHNHFRVKTEFSEGVEFGVLKIAKNMLKKGLSLDLISELTHLPVKLLEQLDKSKIN